MSKILLKKATEYCEAHKYRLTQPRQHVLEIVARSKKPLKAYEILKLLGEISDNPKPPTVYRAIEFWQAHGFVHRIESLNAYRACEAGHQHKGSHFMICDDCGDVTEAHLCDLPQSLKDSVNNEAFKLARWSFEIHGTCSNCN